jgi:hypothetical protein
MKVAIARVVSGDSDSKRYRSKCRVTRERFPLLYSCILRIVDGRLDWSMSLSTKVLLWKRQLRMDTMPVISRTSMINVGGTLSIRASCALMNGLASLFMSRQVASMRTPDRDGLTMVIHRVCVLSIGTLVCTHSIASCLYTMRRISGGRSSSLNGVAVLSGGSSCRAPHSRIRARDIADAKVVLKRIVCGELRLTSDASNMCSF